MPTPNNGWLDAPNEPGWWWLAVYYSGYEFVLYNVLEDEHGTLYIRNDPTGMEDGSGRITRIRDLAIGSWSKATVTGYPVECST